MVGYLVEAPEVEWALLEIWKLIVKGKRPERADHRHERGLACAVLPDKERERSETCGLLISEATEVS